MTTKLFLNIILVLFLNTLFSQIVFNNVYDIDSLYDGFATVVECKDSSLIAVGQSFNLSLSVTKTFVEKTDKYGNSIWGKSYALKPNTSNFALDVIKSPNEDFYIVGIFKDTSQGVDNSFLLKINQNGDSLYSKIFTDTLISVAPKILFKNNYLYILQWLGYSIPYGDLDFRILKTDTFGNIVDTWFYDGTEFEAIQDFKFTPDGGFILAGNEDSLAGALNNDFYMVKLDGFGNIQWQYSYGTSNNETTRNHNFLALTKDGGYVMCGYEDLISPQFGEGVLLKVDNLGNQLWRKQIHEGELTICSSVREWGDGSLILTGITSNYTVLTPPFNEPRGFLLKISPDGNEIIWERYFSKFWLDDDDPNSGGYQSQDYVHGMILTTDGGILATGYQIYPSITLNDGWLIKFDSCGFTTGAQPQALLTIDSVEGSTVYISNLSEEYCTAQLLLGNGDSVNLYAYSAYTNGTDPTQLQYTFTDTGTYTLTLYTYAGDGIDTFTTQVHIADTATSIQVVIASASEAISISLFPNPAEDYFIVEMAPSLTLPQGEGNSPLWWRGAGGEAKGAIYTPTGQLVQSFSLNPNVLQQRIFLNDLANGIYFVHFTYNGQHVGTERLSVVR